MDSEDIRTVGEKILKIEKQIESIEVLLQKKFETWTEDEKECYGT